MELVIIEKVEVSFRSIFISNLNLVLVVLGYTKCVSYHLEDDMMLYALVVTGLSHKMLEKTNV